MSSNEKPKWFLLTNNEISGPYHEDEIAPLAAASPDALIWGHGLSEWVSPGEWKKSLSSLDEILKSLKEDMNPSWMLKQGEDESGPFTYDQLVQTLKNHPMPAEVLFKQLNEPDWNDIYHYPTLVEEVGITRRQHNRVPISGIFRYEKNGILFDSLLASVSQGGIGIVEAQGIAVGDKLRGQIESPQLATTINCQCDVLYLHQDGHWGLRFVNLPAEAQTIIIEYTRKFAESNQGR